MLCFTHTCVVCTIIFSKSHMDRSYKILSLQVGLLKNIFFWATFYLPNFQSYSYDTVGVNSSNKFYSELQFAFLVFQTEHTYLVKSHMQRALWPVQPKTLRTVPSPSGATKILFWWFNKRTIQFYVCSAPQSFKITLKYFYDVKITTFAIIYCQRTPPTSSHLILHKKSGKLFGLSLKAFEYLQVGEYGLRYIRLLLAMTSHKVKLIEFSVIATGKALPWGTPGNCWGCFPSRERCLHASHNKKIPYCK